MERHGQFLRRLARALVRDEGAAADLEQDTWAAALELREPLREPRAWLAATARRLAWTRGRSDRRRADRERLAAKEEHVAARSLDAGDLLQKALRGLDEPYKSVVVARYLEGLLPQEIADRTGTPVGTVKSRLKRGLVKLREELDAEHGGERRAWCQILVVGLAGRAADLGGAMVDSSAPGSVSTNSSAVTPASRGSATAPWTSGGLWTAAIAMKLSALAIAPIIAVAFLWIRGSDTNGPMDLAPTDRPSTEVVAPVALLDDVEVHARRDELGAPETALLPVQDAGGEYSLSLAVEVLDEFGRPAPSKRVILAPVGHPLNSVGFTNRAGQLKVSWESRKPAMEMEVAVYSGEAELTGVRRVRVRNGQLREIKVRAPMGRGSKFRGRFVPYSAEIPVVAVHQAPDYPDCVHLRPGEIGFRLREAEPIEDSFEVFDVNETRTADFEASEVPQDGILMGTVVNSQGLPVPGYAISWTTVPGEGSEERPGREQRVITDQDGAFRIESPPAHLAVSAGPVGNTVDLDVHLRSGETRVWNPLISQANDLLIELVHPEDLDVDNIILEASFDNGETLWVGRAMTSESGHATILNWPHDLVDVALIAPEKIANVPMVNMEGVRTGEPFRFTLPSDSGLTVLPVTSELPAAPAPGARLTALHIYNADLTRGTRVWVPRQAAPSAMVLPGGEWNYRWVWEHGAIGTPQRVLVVGDQPIDLGQIRAAKPARLVVPEAPSGTARFQVSQRLAAIDSTVYDSDDPFDELPKDRTLMLPDGTYLVRLTDGSGGVREDTFVLEENVTHDLVLP